MSSPVCAVTIHLVNKSKSTRRGFGLTGKRPELRESLGITAETNISAITGNVSNTAYFEPVIFFCGATNKMGLRSPYY